ATARMARSRSPTRGASATKLKTCSRKAKTRAPRSSSTSTGRRPPDLSSNGPTRGSRRRRGGKTKAAGTPPWATPRTPQGLCEAKSIEVLELRVGYVKDRFGKLCRQDIKRPDVLAFMRSYEAEGKMETRDRVRSIGEQVCDYADVEGNGYNPFRNLHGQMIANISTPRPGVTELRDVTRVFKLISTPWTRARFSDVVGLALRFDALTIPRPGMVNEMEWCEVDWDTERWTIPAAKMKTGWDHVVPLSRQALTILRSVQQLPGHRRYAFSCSKDAPLSNNTLNKRLRLLGIDTKTDHCAHGFRTTFSTLSHHEEIKDAKAWDGDVVELQLAHLDNSTVEGLYKKHGPLALIGSRTKLMQHWADRIDHWLDPKKVMAIKGGAQA